MSVGYALVFLFIYRSVDHRDLHVLTHTFPTRRTAGLVAATWQLLGAAKGQAGRLVAGCMVGVIEAEPKGYGLVSAVANIRDMRGRHKLLALDHAPPTIRAPKPTPAPASSMVVSRTSKYTSDHTRSEVSMQAVSQPTSLL